jgi:glycosyltransferase involved in cell wall biosynthesis
MTHVAAVIPALDEERALPGVLANLPRSLVDVAIVVDNGSTDCTAEVARASGAIVVREERRGYGRACLAGIAAARVFAPCVLLFMDADGSDDPRDIERVVTPVLAGDVDLVIGSRTLGHRERGALPPHARIGNLLATRLIRLLWGMRFTDLGPLRAVRVDALDRLNMRDPAFGWTVEMQVKAAKLHLRCLEVPVSYRRRIGRSKISGSLVGSVRAAAGILGTIAREAYSPLRAHAGSSDSPRAGAPGAHAGSSPSR